MSTDQYSATAHPLLERARQLSNQTIELRHRLSRCPEIAYEEVRTAAICREAIEALSYRVSGPYAKTGFIAELGDDGPIICIRTDMDGLPMQDALTTPWASQTTDRKHACGHDGHMASVVCAAHLLAELFTAGKLPGRLRFIFQPAEESGGAERKSGAKRMVEEGVLNGAQAIIGQHYMPHIPLGQVTIHDGPTMAACSPFEIVIRGNGGHIADEDTIDTIEVAALIKVGVKPALRILKMAGTKGIIGFGTVASSTQATNIVPEIVTERGSIRSLSSTDQQVLKMLLTGLFEQSLASVPGARGDLDWLGDIPVTSNNPIIAEEMRQAATSILGENGVIDTPRLWAGEDFANYGALTGVPSAFLLTGTKEEGIERKLHTTDYDLPDAVLPIGAAILAETAVRLMLMSWPQRLRQRRWHA